MKKTRKFDWLNDEDSDYGNSFIMACKDFVVIKDCTVLNIFVLDYSYAISMLEVLEKILRKFPSPYSLVVSKCGNVSAMLNNDCDMKFEINDLGRSQRVYLSGEKGDTIRKIKVLQSYLEDFCEA